MAQSFDYFSITLGYDRQTVSYQFCWNTLGWATIARSVDHRFTDNDSKYVCNLQYAMVMIDGFYLSFE